MRSIRLWPALVATLLACSGSGAPAAAAGILTMEAGPVDFSFAFKQHATVENRLLQMVTPGSHPWFVNAMFPPAGYDINCDTPYVLSRPDTPAAASVAAGAVQEYRVCRIVSAPVVDADFIGFLKAQNYDYEISYPFENNGNGHALVFWTDGGVARGNPPTSQGFARITNMAWTDQFAAAARCVNPQASCVWRYFEHGDAFGGFINRFPAPDRQSAARIYQQIGFDKATLTPITGASIVIDSWLSEKPTPSAAPDIQAAATAAQVTGQPTTPPRIGGVVFDHQAFCTQPGPNGRQRSDAWIQNCLANAVN